MVLAVFLGLTATVVGASAAESQEDLSTQRNLLLLNELGYDNSDVLTLSASDNTRYAQLGFAKERLSDITPEIREYIGDMEGTLVAVNQTYTKINPDGTREVGTKEEYEKDKLNQARALLSPCNPTYGCSDREPTSNWMVLTTTVSSIANTSPREYLIRHDFQFTKEPTETNKDAVGTGHNVNLSTVQNSGVMTYSYERSTSNNPIIGAGPWTTPSTVTKYKYSAEKKGAGIGYELSLLGSGFNNADGQWKHTNHRGSVMYRVYKNNSAATISDVSGHFLHLTTQISASLGIDIRGTGSFSINATTKYIPATETGVTFSVQ